MPGVLPVLNKKAVEYAMQACLATHCQINPRNTFDRKNYFYPDLPKGYQITQLNLPIGEHGHIDIDLAGVKKRIGITRIHMEEDAGKLVHGENEDQGKSYVDLNRTGIPLVEIVSEPEIRSPSDCNMEEGSLRCDANISLRPFGQNEFGTRTELKNLNSFRFVQKAIEYEVERQTRILEQGDKVIQETRLYDSDKGVTRSMRSKEEAHDYRYFPEPDLVRLTMDAEWVDLIRKTIPELPEQKRERFVAEHDIPEYDAGVLTASQSMANYYEECVALHPHPKIISNWIMGDLSRELKNDDREIEDCPVTPGSLTDLLKLIDKGTISGKMAKTVFEEMYRSGKSAEEIVKQKGMGLKRS
jgi:aspartyl-tRNA(Asn)/glutamyl-tRNA(Gln) amidotransferase subunit B